jgi:hypothetical protein
MACQGAFRLLTTAGKARRETRGSAAWQGGIEHGKGAISTEGEAIKDYPLRIHWREPTPEITPHRAPSCRR